MSKFFNVKRIGFGCAMPIIGVVFYITHRNPVFAKENSQDKSFKILMERPPILPKRSNLLEKLRSDQIFDVFIIGGGATGCGVAVDAAVKGLNVALVERGDFSSGTSSKSTKLIHGGVRYLQNAVFKMDINEYHLVKEALQERKRLMDNCPYLTNPIPIMIPLYEWWQVPYYWTGLKMYDLLAGTQFFRSSYMLSKDKTIDEFPLIKKEKLRGAVVYYDGQMDDTRLNLILAMTSIQAGAVCVNYVEVLDIIDYDEYSQVLCKDVTNGNVFECKSRVIVNATGPFTDSIRQMHDKQSKDICIGASGTHVILPKYFCPKSMGLLNANTSDNRVIFLLPWNGYTLAGTTDNKCSIVNRPKSSKEDIDFILKEVNKYLNPDIKIRTNDIKSVWSGIRPLILDISKSKDNGGTATICRNHVIEVKGNFITIAGGKWTIYRTMADDTMKHVIESLNKLNKSKYKSEIYKNNTKKSTINYKLYGSTNWTPYFYISLINDFNIDEDIAKHISKKYGMASLNLINIAKKNGDTVIMNRIDSQLPITEEEIRYCCRHEYVVTAVDLMARRFLMFLLDTQKAKSLLPKIIDIMADEFKWDNTKKNEEIKAAESYLNVDYGLDFINRQKKLK